ncbi:topoisomerase DNA-binding C4 zinc finger domain-containing protein [Aestuariibacter sp. AA17]|uniref:Topoisomerase DNA-binding C4 zinc finger domain-containing protein n=1 Tax=Fluctibacter corallii TaxID=2984329 RepID=A0ABT3AD20_9ALTE|nr:topoisomerase DNA-binding C4 zinc finger domain-containing protein [Aestuariibacter sp. AA17]MCV2886571.1 topoisomerase DNA-binding C4 zinc finger domain-containing protein [Aestuariibacter sp. AA17]
MSKIDHSLFKASEHALENAFGTCPLCDAQLRIRNSKNGRFIGCTHYPECTFSKPLHETETTQLKVIDGSSCPECQQALAIKKGRFGLFIGCTAFPECHHIETVKQQSDTEVACPKCKKGKLIKRTNKYGKTFYACNQYPHCKYLLNSKPVAKSCEACGWAVMIEKNTTNGVVCLCPQKDCQHKVAQG